MKKTKSIFWAILGFFSMGIGAAGVVLPILPTFPFLALALFCFAKSSERAEAWFRGTGLCRKYLAPFLERRVMTFKTKLTVMVSMTVLMGIGFLMMEQVPAGRVLMGAVWLFHILYFSKGVRTEPGLQASGEDVG